MRKLVVVAALALIATSAQAKEVHEIKFGGRVVRIEVPTNCKKPSCLHLSAKESATGKGRKTSEPATSAAPPVSNGAGAGAASAGAVSAGTPTTLPQEPVRPASVSQSTAQSTYTAVPTNEPQAEPQPDGRRPVARLSLPPGATAEETRPVPAATANQVSAYEPRSEPTRSVEPTPVGLWVTEKDEGRVRIEECGRALCGHTEGKPNEKILLDMQPGEKNRWNGKIHDVRGGSTYTSHMSLKNANALRVEGCAFGGLFCGGQTWTRAQ